MIASKTNKAPRILSPVYLFRFIVFGMAMPFLTIVKVRLAPRFPATMELKETVS